MKSDGFILLSTLLVLLTGSNAYDCSSWQTFEMSTPCNSGITTFSLDAGLIASGETVQWSTTSTKASFTSGATAQHATVAHNRGTSITCGDSSIRVTLTVTPASGAPVVCHQNKVIKDETAPNLIFSTIPQDKIDSDSQEVDDVDAAEVAECMDDCDGVREVGFVENLYDAAFGNTDPAKFAYAIERKWTATDKCGNVVNQAQSIDVVDTTPPVFAGLPANVTLSCTEDLPPCATVTASDNSGNDVQTTYDTTKIDVGCDHGYTLQRTWTAVDEQGNVATETLYAVFSDDEAPTLTGAPVSLTVECDVVPDAAEVTISDNCDTNAKIDYSEVVLSRTNTHTFSLVRSWTGVDACGNENEHLQTIDVEDTVAPTVEIDADETIECYGHTPSACPSAISDNCDDSPELTFSESQVAGSCANEYDLVHTYILKDESGNLATASRTISVQDTSAPTLKGVPADITVECDAPEAVNVTAFDTCEEGVVITAVMFENELEATADGSIIERAWTATDQCGHASSDYQTITMADTTPPTLLHVPTTTSINVGCNMVPDAAVVSAEDNCCDNVNVTFTEASTAGNCDTEYTLVRTWSSTDCNGNSAGATQTILVHSVDPVLTNLPVASLQVAYTNQSQTIPVADVGVTVWCGEVLTVDMTESGKVVGSCDNSFDITRNFSATNGCGTASYTQNIHIFDTVSPTVSTPDNRATSCAYNTSAWGVTSTDSDGATIAVVETCVNTGLNGNPSDECYGKRTCDFVATDPCGNTASSSAYDIWQDVDAPVLDGNCSVDEVTTATDVCQGEISVVKTTETEAGACPIMYITVDTYTATDTCGLASTCVRRTGTYDQESPVIIGTPANATYECLSEVPDLANLTATDNFDTAATTAVGNEYTVVNGCSTDYIRTWTVCDCANNCAESKQTITVEETTAPTISFSGADAIGENDSTQECPFTVPVATMNVTTHCGATHAVTATTGLSTPDGLPYPVTHVHSWSWTDGCLSHSHDQTVIVEDTTPPVVTHNETVLNDCTYRTEDATSTDSCTTSSCVISSTTSTGAQLSSCEEYVNTWVCTDEVGNAATAVQQTIRSVDEQGPSITTVLVPEVTLECPDTYTVPTVQASDNCGNFQVDAPVVQNTPVVAGKTGTDIYTWTATDQCGLTDTITQTVITSDTSAPVFDTPLNPNLEVDCAPTGFVTQTTTDACDGVVAVVETEAPVPTCTHGGTVIYTYTATDASGQVGQTAQTVVYSDNEAPTVAQSELANLTIGDETTIESTSPETGLQAEAQDNCGGSVTVACNSEDTAIQCKTRAVWSCTLTDECGNVNTLQNYLTVTQVHSYNVTLSSKPASVSLDCTEPMPAVVDVTTVDGTVVASPTVTLSGTNAACSTYLRSWAVSYCDHEDSHEQTITFTDTTAPVISPDTYTPYQCLTDVPSISASTATVNDTCDDSASLVIADATANMADSVKITRTYTASDVCGLNSVMHRTITVQDTTDPTMTNLPANVSIACLDPFPTTQPAAQDNCGSVTMDYTVTTDTPGCPCNFVSVRTWVATDEYANTYTHIQTVTSTDTVSPVLTPTPTETVSVEWADWSNSSNTYSTMETLTGTDDVDGDVTVTATDVRTDGTSPYHFTVHRTWSTSDACGNPAVATQTMIVSDNVPPEPCIPTNQQVECDDIASIISAQAVGEACTATFSEDVTFSYSARNEMGSCENDYKIINDFTITDQGGNSATFEQTVTVVDSQPPYFDTHALNKTTSIVASQCDAEGPIAVTAQDACSTPSVTSDTVEAPAGTFKTTYTAVDSCGHTATTLVTEYLVDITPPVIVLDGVAVQGTEDTANVDCEEGTLPVYECEEVCDLTCSISLSSNTIDTNCTHSGVRIQEWTASDVAGNTAKFTHTVIFTDTEGPAITTGADRNCECGETDCFPSATAADNCDALSLLSLADDGNPNGLFTYTATDTCGNTETAIQTITGSNDTPPTFSGGADYTVECSDMTQNRPIPSVDNDCGPLTMEDVDTSIVNENCATDSVLSTIIRTWTVTDLAGFTADQNQTVTITDSQDPVLSGVPEDNLHYECNEPTHVVTASDSCDGNIDVTISRVDTSGTYSLSTEMTWTATDTCGKVATATRTFDVQDTTNPVPLPASLPDVQVTCRQLPGEPTVSYSDNCGNNVSVTMTTETWNGTCANDGVYVRTWTGVDSSALQTVITQTITSVAVVNPTCTVTPDQDITCVETYFESADMVQCTDECGNSLTADRDDQLSVSCGGGSAESGQVVWTTTDSCGLSQQISQNRQKTDGIDPTFSSFPDDATSDCGPETPEAAVPADTCSSVTVANETVTVAGTCEHQGSVITQFTATDGCGNTHAENQTSTYDDTNSPVLSGEPANVTIDCSDTEDVATVTALDDCAASVSVSMVPVTQTGTTDNIKTVTTRTYFAQDSCGNSASHVQTITQIDTTPPTLHGTFTDLTFQCVSVPASNVTATDDCGTATVTVDEEVTENCGGTSVTVLTYTATDEVGLTSEQTRTIEVVDTQVPTLSFVGTAQDTTIECGDDRPTATCSASDDCDSSVTCELTETEESDPSTTLVIRSYTSVDSCGNDVTEVFTITILDTTDPVIVAPDDATHDCGTAVVPAAGTVSDVCDTGIALTTVSDSSAPCEGSMVYTYDYTATDASGLTASNSTTITYTDLTPPTFAVTTTDATYQCGDTPDVPDFDAAPTDDCGSVSIIKSDESESNITCPITSKIAYTLNAQDDCGNLATAAVVTYTFEDTTPPQVASSATDVTAQSGDAVPLPSVTFTDVCSVVNETFSQTSTGDNCARTVVRTWSATDQCGNAASEVQTVTYLESVPPTLVEVPADITIECGDDYSLGTPYATDRTGRFLDVNTTKSTNLGECSCQGNYIYTWSVTDECNQVTTDSTTVTIQDTTPPVITCQLADVTTSCDVVPNNEPRFALDISSSVPLNVSVHEVREESNVCDSSYKLIRTYNVEDCSTNVYNTVQTITVVDDAAPVFTRTVSDKTVECSCDAAAEDYVQTDLEVSDNCDATAAYVYSESKTPTTGSNNYLSVRSWVATDACGNSATRDQTITVQDTTAPVISGKFEDEELACEYVKYAPAPNNVGASDACEGDITVTYNETQHAGSCGSEYELVRSWSASDQNGNSATEVQTVAITDTEAPVVVGPNATCLSPPDASVYQVSLVDIFTVHDNCDSVELVDITPMSCNSTEVTFDEANLDFPSSCSISNDDVLSVVASRLGGSAPGVAREYVLYAEVSDQCGNTAIQSHTFSVPAPEDAVGCVAGGNSLN